MSRLFFSLIAIYLVILGGSTASWAQGEPGGEYGVTQPENVETDWIVRQLAEERLVMLGTDLLGDSVDPDTGGIVFSHTDISLPGNSSLDVSVRRRLAQGWTYRQTVQVDFADWALDIPKITDIYTFGSGGPMPDHCSGSQIPNPDESGTGPTTIIPYDKYSNGISLHIPGQGARSVQRLATGPQWPAGTELVTIDNWAIKCLPASGNTLGREGFSATAPNGDYYRFDRMITRDATMVGYEGGGIVDREYYIWLATEVTDVNGNWVRYNYDVNGRLLDITSNDGRRIDFNYSGSSKLIESISTNGRTWQYDYDQYGRNLKSVTKPDGRQWTFSLGGMRTRPRTGYINAQSGQMCVQPDITLSLTHPTGMTGTYTLKETRHWKKVGLLKNLAGDCDSVPSKITKDQPFFETMSVTQKTLSGPGYPAANWNWSYEGWNGQSYQTAGGELKWTTMTDPEGRVTKWYHNRVVGDYEGLLIRQEAYQNGNLLQIVYNTYTIGASISEPFPLYTPGARKPRPLATSNTSRDGDIFYIENQYNMNTASADYSYGNPIISKSWSSVSTTPRETLTTYQHDKVKWILGLPTTITVNGRLEITNGYDALGRKSWTDRYGVRIASYAYHSNPAYLGAPYSITNANNFTTYALDWKRGTAQQITRPDGLSEYQYVDDNGWLSSLVDARGFTTSYTRDNMGRLTKIIPSKTENSWLDTDISYSFGANTVQTITKGNAQTIVTYDGMLRPALVETKDLSTGISSYVNTRYNGLNETVFTSQPSYDPTEAAGINTFYDGLGRVISTAETVAPFATTSTEYLSGHRTRITDASGAQTTNYNNGFGELIRIEQPLGVNTYLNRNIWGQMLSLRQAGTQNGITMDQTNTYVYDAQQRLCRHHTNEGGSTLYQYDAAGQMIAYSKGNAAGSTCVTPSGQTRVDLFYDDLGRNWAEVFADANTPTISRMFDANGNVTVLARDGVNWFYWYNELNMLTAEILHVDTESFNSGYAYDTAGNMIARTYPTPGVGLISSFDGLGRVTKLQSATQVYADNINYHPSGAMASMTYGNGQVFTQTLNARLQPFNTRTAKPGGAVALDYTYAYNVRGKVTSVTDLINTANNRNYAYDQLGRLTSASGPWGAGSFTYDALGNIRTKTLGTRNVINSYDSLNRVSQTADSVKGTRSISHDVRGNVVQLGAQGFAYDMSDQPVSIFGAASGTYTYDGNRKRVKSVVNGKTIYNVYDASGTLVHVFDQSANKRTDYIGEIARITNGNVTYLHKDHLGSASSGTTSTGAVAWNEQYTPFGETILNPAANDNLDGFTGHIKDAATGLNYMQARYYDPLIGRFLSIDPVGFSPDMPFMFGRYTYVGNDPINLTDPTGKNPAIDRRADQVFKATQVLVADYDLAVGIVAEQSRLFPGVDNANDAMRHATTSKRLTEELETGELGAKVLSNLNELRGQHSENPAGEKNTPLQREMDLTNDTEGRNAASEGREINPDNLVVIETDENGTKKIVPFPTEESK